MKETETPKDTVEKPSVLQCCFHLDTFCVSERRLSLHLMILKGQTNFHSQKENRRSMLELGHTPVTLVFGCKVAVGGHFFSAFRHYHEIKHV